MEVVDDGHKLGKVVTPPEPAAVRGVDVQRASFAGLGECVDGVRHSLLVGCLGCRVSTVRVTQVGRQVRQRVGLDHQCDGNLAVVLFHEVGEGVGERELRRGSGGKGGEDSSIASHRIASHHITSHYITSHHTTPHHTTPDQTTPHHTTPHHTTPEHTRPDQTRLDQTRPHRISLSSPQRNTPRGAPRRARQCTLSGTP